MSKSIVLLVVLVFLLFSLAATAKRAEAQYAETVTIKVDGSIDPATAPISTVDNVTYTLTGDIYFDMSADEIQCIKVERFNIVLDGAGHTIQGSGGGRGIEIANPYGVPISEGYNVTVKNFNVKGFGRGISVYGFWGNIISGVVIAENNVTSNYLGVTFSSYYTYSNNVIIGNNITENYAGIDISMANEGGKTKGNLITKNYVANNTFGMVFYWKSSESYWYGSAGELQYSNVWDMNNTVFNNNFVNNSQNVYNPILNLYPQPPACSNVWDTNRTGNFWSDYNGTDADGDGVGDTVYVIDDYNQDIYPLMAPVDFTEPSILVLSPENKTYGVGSVPLVFTVDEAVAQVTFSLDGGENVTISGNTTLTGLLNGNHNVTVYAMDEAGNTGTSEAVYFNVDAPFPTALVAAAAIASAGVIAVGLVVYFKKRKH